MTFRQLAFVPITLALMVLLAACGSQNSMLPAITVTFTPSFEPPTSMIVNEQCGIAATVTNDNKNAGVNWTVTCGSAGQCGSFSPLPSSASAVPVTYTAPAAIPNGKTVTVTATSVTDPTKFVSSSPIPITQTVSSGCVQPQ